MHDETKTTLQNDYGETVTVKVCPLQECDGQKTLEMKRNETLRISANRSNQLEDTLDSVEVISKTGSKTCLLLPMPAVSHRTVKLTEADQETC